MKPIRKTLIKSKQYLNKSNHYWIRVSFAYLFEQLVADTNMGAEGNATGIINMRKAIDFMKKQNQL